MKGSSVAEEEPWLASRSPSHYPDLPHKHYYLGLQGTQLENCCPVPANVLGTGLGVECREPLGNKVGMGKGRGKGCS
jgi:hypothetical protein